MADVAVVAAAVLAPAGADGLGAVVGRVGWGLALLPLVWLLAAAMRPVQPATPATEEPEPARR